MEVRNEVSFLKRSTHIRNTKEPNESMLKESVIPSLLSYHIRNQYVTEWRIEVTDDVWRNMRWETGRSSLPSAVAHCPWTDIHRPWTPSSSHHCHPSPITIIRHPISSWLSDVFEAVTDVIDIFSIENLKTIIRFCHVLIESGFFSLAK